MRRAVDSNQRWVAGRAVLRHKSSEHTFHWISDVHAPLPLGAAGSAGWKKLRGGRRERD